MSVDTAPGTATRTAVPLITSGPEALRAARESAASIAGGVIERDRAGAVPARELAALVATGLLGITVPRGYGGPDLPATVLAEVVRAADERHDLSRHWRNARTHGSHDPVAWKYHHAGNYLLNDVLPPNHGQL